MAGLVQRDVLRERVDRSEPYIPGPIGVAPDALEMVEKVADKCWGEILKRQRRGGPRPNRSAANRKTRRNVSR
jgi:hypothetical protein